MKIKIQKMDGRHNGNTYFTYMALMSHYQKSENMAIVRDIRQWCWEQFGPSCEYYEYEDIARVGEVNPRWCWLGSERILIKDEVDRNWFALRWG